MEIEGKAAQKVAICARGTPRIALRLMRRIRDFAHYHKSKSISFDLVVASLARLGVDSIGLDQLDYKYINYIFMHMHAGVP